MQTSLSPSVCRAFLGCQLEKAVDELNLSKKIIPCHPSNLLLPDHVDRFGALNFVDPPRLVGRLEMRSQSLLQLRAVILHPAPDRCVVDVETALLQQFLNIA